MKTVEEAFAAIRSEVSAFDEETLVIGEASGRIAAQPLKARVDLPLFDQSAMDGIALRAADGASAGVALPLAGTIAAGLQDPAWMLPAHRAVRIYTGAPVPRGADTVIPRENLRFRDGEVEILKPVREGANIRRRGEELHAGRTLVEAGERLSPGLCAALSMAGVSEVSAYRRPRVMVVTTGDEVVPPGSEPRYGQVFDANATMIAGWLRARGYQTSDPQQVRWAHLADDPGALTDALAGGGQWQPDIVLTTGGVSVGDRDYVHLAAEESGWERVFWKVAQKPGKPLLFARSGQSRAWLLGIPGNPGAVFATLQTHARLLFDCAEGVVQPGPRWHTGIVDERLRQSDRAIWYRCRREVDAEGRIRLKALGKQGSHMLSNLATADTLAWIPANNSDGEISEGSVLSWCEIAG